MEASPSRTEVGERVRYATLDAVRFQGCHNLIQCSSEHHYEGCNLGSPLSFLEVVLLARPSAVSANADGSVKWHCRRAEPFLRLKCKWMAGKMHRAQMEAVMKLLRSADQYRGGYEGLVQRFVDVELNKAT